MLRRNAIVKLITGVTIAAFIAVSGVTTSQTTGIFNANAVDAAATETPKYVFYFIGDGLGTAQRTSAEYFLQETSGNKSAKLLMNTFPVAGINTTHAADTLVTDSAAAGTALATGHKTNNGMISILPNGKNVKTLVEAAEEKGMATGIVTTTELTHATPAVFASHNASRNGAPEIAVDYLDSGVDYFAGGGIAYFVPKSFQGSTSKRADERNVFNEFYKQGYKVFESASKTEEFRSYQPKGKEKVIAAFASGHLPYEVERKQKNDTPSLAELTQKGIDILTKYDKGFFMMVEGGRIDHACHAQDIASSVYDTLAFDESIKKAYEFYQKHPSETLIVVVGDHETGGMGLGFGNNYFLKMNEIVDVKVSVEDNLNKAKAYKANGNREEYFKYLEANFSLDKLTDSERAIIAAAMDTIDKGETNDRAYGTYNPVAIAAAHVLDERANAQFTTFAHSGTVIPMSAIGVGAETFSGYKDNTEIAKVMANLMGFVLDK